jgi:photosystem II stability/assembly factor-like uncharacterized protein
MSARTALKLALATAILLASGSSAAVFAATRQGVAGQNVAPATTTTSPEWSAHPMGAGEDAGANCVHFLDSAEGWAGGEKGRLYHTTDGGLTWTLSHLPNRTLYVKQVQFVGKLRGWALAEGSYKVGAYGYNDWRLYRTTDGGVTWKWLWTRKASAVDEFQFVDANRGWFAGGHKVYTTGNGGTTLSDQHADRKMAAPLSLANLTGLRFTDAKHGWVCGGYIGGWTKPIMLRTSDGGKTWRSVKSGLSSGINDVWFGNGTTGYAIGNGLYRTTNAGGSWRRIKHTSKEGYDSVQAFGVSDVRMIGSVEANTAYGNSVGRVWTSRDGGSTWKSADPQVKDGGGASWAAMSFLDADTGWIAGNIWRRTEGVGLESCVLRTPAVAETPAPTTDPVPEEDPTGEPQPDDTAVE